MVKKIRKTLPGASITTDIIVGFCGETPEQFKDTSKLFEDIRWDMAYLARYSPRPGTVSHKVFKDDVSRAEKARRWHILNTILKECSSDYHKKLIGKTLEVLVERYDKTTRECEGKSRENKLVQFVGTPELVGTIVNVTVKKALPWNVKGSKA
jgi:tRNA-2-methylthio-N6-dimethylallyladenosine synthase